MSTHIHRALALSTVLLGLAVIGASSVASLDLPVTTSPILDPITTIVPTPTSETTPPPTSEPAITTINTEQILPTTGEGAAATSTASTTSSSSVGGDSSPTPTKSADPKTTDSGSSGLPAYSGGFYTKNTGAKTAAVAGTPGAQSGPLGQAGELVDGALEGGSGDGQAGAGGQDGTEPQSGPEPEYVAVPGPGIAIILVLVAALVLVIARRGLH